jgi:hypothetical protein
MFAPGEDSRWTAMTLARYLLPKDIPHRAMAPFIP